MRVLILSALLALVSSSPIGEEAAPAPVAPETPAAPEIPEGMPAVQPGDLEAAEINAKAFAADQAQIAADQAQLAADQAQHAMDQARMFSEEAVEEQKEKLEEQAAALKAAQAQIDGQIAQNSQLIARSMLGNGFVAPIIAGSPIPLVYSAPGLAGLNLAPAKPEEHEAPKPVESHAEKIENPLLKSAEPAKEEPSKEAIAAIPTAQLGQIGLLTAPLTIPGYTFPAVPSLTPLAYTAPLTYYPSPNLPLSFIPAPMVAPIPRSQTGL